MPEFTQDWLSNAELIFKLTLDPLKGKDNLQFLEIGSFEGRSAIWMLDNVLTGNNCKITCIDSFKGSNEFNEKLIKVDGLEQRFLSNMKPYIGKYQLLKGQAEVLLRDKNLIDKFDVIYIDGSHEASDTLEDACLSYRLLKVNGLMLLDDYMWHYDRLQPYQTPKVAIDGFMASFKNKMKPEQVSWKTVVLRKIA